MEQGAGRSQRNDAVGLCRRPKQRAQGVASSCPCQASTPARCSYREPARGDNWLRHTDPNPDRKRNDGSQPQPCASEATAGLTTVLLVVTFLIVTVAAVVTTTRVPCAAYY